MAKTNQFYKCNCGCQVLEVDDSFVKEDGEVYFSVWQNGRHKPMYWGERIRWIWKIIRSGDLWSDNIILTREQCGELARQLFEASKEDS